MRRIFACLTLSCLCCLAAPQVQVGVESHEVSVGESFIYQVVVSDGNKIGNIAFPSNDDFMVQAMAPQSNNSTQVSIVNGRMNRVVTRETICNFNLVAKHKGTLTIPSLKVVVDGKEFHTKPVKINASEGEASSGLYLELSFGTNECYVGQTLMAKWTLYFEKPLVQIGEFSLPLFTDAAFSFPAYEDKLDQNMANSYRRIPVDGVDGIVGKLGIGSYDGMQMRCLSFQRPVTLQKAGQFTLQSGNVICEVEDKNARRRRSNDPFGDSFFDGFFDRTPTKRIMVTGKSVTLNVRELPSQGRPADFSGILGKCTLEVTAKPTEVNVGDPIVLTVSVSGIAFPDAVRIPPLSSQSALKSKFRVSDEDSGIVRDNAKVFQCTLRALSSDVTEIPSLKLSYFDSTTGQYAFAESKPVPLVVHAVKTVTMADVQGNAAEAPVTVGTELKTLDAGIAHNYAYYKLMRDDRPGFSNWRLSGWKFLLCAGCLLMYVVLASVAAVLRNGPDQAAQARQEAISSAKKTIANASDNDAAALFNALQALISAKTGMPPGVLSLRDASSALAKKGMKSEALEKLSGLFNDFEAANYAGGTVRNGIAEDTRRLACEIQKLRG